MFVQFLFFTNLMSGQRVVYKTNFIAKAGELCRPIDERDWYEFLLL